MVALLAVPTVIQAARHHREASDHLAEQKRTREESVRAVGEFEAKEEPVSLYAAGSLPPCCTLAIP
jgi:hypothetical protein